MSKANKWNEQHIKVGRVVAYRPKLTDRTRFGVVKALDFKSVTVEFVDETKVVIKDDLTPVFSKFHP